MKSNGFMLTLAALLIVLAYITLVNNHSEAQNKVLDYKSEIHAVNQLDRQFKSIEDPIRRLSKGDNRRRDVAQRMIPFEYKIENDRLTIYSLVNLTDNDPSVDPTRFFFNTVNFYRAFVRDANITEGFITDINTPKNTSWGGTDDNLKLAFSIAGTCTRMVIYQNRNWFGSDGNQAVIWFELDPNQIQPDNFSKRCMTGNDFPPSEYKTVWQKYVQDINVYFVTYTDYAKEGLTDDYAFNQVEWYGYISCNDPFFTYDPAKNNIWVGYLDSEKKYLPANNGIEPVMKRAIDPTTEFQCNFSLRRKKMPSVGEFEFYRLFQVDVGDGVDYNIQSLRFLKVNAPMSADATLGNGAVVIQIKFRHPVEELYLSDVQVHAFDAAHGFYR